MHSKTLNKIMLFFSTAMLLAFLAGCSPPSASNRKRNLADISNTSLKKECEEWNYSVVETPVNARIKIDPCGRIVVPPETVILFETNENPFADNKRTTMGMKFDGRKRNISSQHFRVGSKGGTFEVRLANPDTTWKMLGIVIWDVPHHLRGGENALMYELATESAVGKKIDILREYYTQIMVPRGYDIKIMPDLKIRVKYAGTVGEYDADQLVYLQGKPGVDFVEVYGIDRDGSATVGVSPRKATK